MKNETLFDYVKKYGDKSFVAMPFNEVDAAILSLLSYLNFNELVPTLADPSHDTVFSSLDHEDLYDYLLDGTVTPKQDIKLFKLCVKSKRYGNMHLNYALYHFDKIKAIQFFAITYILDNGFVVVTYRGTDSSIIGWKESFMMAIDDHLPAYKFADTYLNIVSELTHHHPLIVIGHSKGGALAVYASIFAYQEVQERIISVYDLDGPGFKNDLKTHHGFDIIYPKIIKIIPFDSMIGILLESSTKTKLVKGRYFSILQHTPYNWYVHNTHFAVASKRTHRSLSLSRNMKDFIAKLSDREKREFVEILFSILEESEIHTIHDLNKRLDRKLILAFKSISSILKDKQKGAMFKRVIATFIHIYFRNIHRRIEDEPGKEIIAYYDVPLELLYHNK